MEKETVIAKLRAEISFTDEYLKYINTIENNSNSWLIANNGNMFLAEFGHDWNTIFTEFTQEFYSEYFLKLGVPQDTSPLVKITDSHSGSWIMDASLTMFGTVGTVYTILKGVSELPDIADGIEKTKNRISGELSDLFNKKVKERIEPIINEISTSPLPKNIINTNFTIDARMARDITPDKTISHSINLSVSISIHTLIIENLGEEPLKDLRIGLFKSRDEIKSWSFNDAYSYSLPIISGKQSIPIMLTNFKLNDNHLDLNDIIFEDKSFHVDCWIQDNYGIYLFNFLLNADNYNG